ncbi:MAG: DUF4251 domain-containing protein [Muribaculaceae bacterium]|nr:DUF4251 domain-containing protein [Muribaculaceae bacterium]
MKTFNLIFSLILVAVFCVPATSWAQNYDDDIYVIGETAPIPENETKKERKERIKKDKEIVDSIYHLKAKLAADDGYFVLQATEVRNSYGRYELGLNDNTNFLLMQGDKGIFQVAFNNMSAGANGLGGVTLHGNISRKELKYDKKGNTIISYMMVGRRMNASVTITLFKGSDQAVADVFPTLGNGRITLRGRLVPYLNEDIRIEP